MYLFAHICIQVWLKSKLDFYICKSGMFLPGSVSGTVGNRNNKKHASPQGAKRR